MREERANVQRSEERLSAALKTATAALMDELVPEGHWVGQLSSSALSTATAVTALREIDRQDGTSQHERLIAAGLRWLTTHRNPDGGWGDTEKSKSNISTTALCWAAFGAANADATYPQVAGDAVGWLKNACGGVSVFSPDPLVSAITARYGKDRTFSVPIVMTLALSGRLGPEGWRHVRHLPFELAALPHQLFGALRLPVVSYALPALIAIGQAVWVHRSRSRCSIDRWRGLFRRKTLRVLETIQPENGGFLEATPLTSFVTMSLASIGEANHPVARKGAEFLRHAMRPDGSWPIDTNLSTWVTTLATKALAHQPAALSPESRRAIREWLLAQQYRVEHPYTHAAPGGWAWTDLPGGVPDADDTPGALLALLALGAVDGETVRAGEAGLRWLLDLQNRDGGIPTFCRGWGALPFDRSGADLTAHALRAWSGWRPHVSTETRKSIDRAIPPALTFLKKNQRDDGTWVPLWFGNEHAPDDENPVHGTAHVLMALRELRHRGVQLPGGIENRAAAFLVSSQNAHGAWSGTRGAPPSIEETALAVEALTGTEHVSAVDAGAQWLAERVESGAWREPAPIGFYFARLWYYERLYPLIFTVGALGRVLDSKLV